MITADWAPSLSAAVALTHEIGHLLGVLHPCELGNQTPMCGPGDVNSALMYPDYAGIDDPSLLADDVAAFCSIYPGESQPCQGTVCSDGTCVIAPATCPPVDPGVDDFGEPCDYGVDCQSSLCLEDDEGTYCSVRCDRRADCPTGALCQTVGDDRACVVSASTCAVSQRPAHAPLASMLLLLLVVIFRRGLGRRTR